jgi:hypothetical protein
MNLEDEKKITEWLERNLPEKVPSRKFRSSNKIRIKTGSVRRNLLVKKISTNKFL